MTPDLSRDTWYVTWAFTCHLAVYPLTCHMTLDVLHIHIYGVIYLLSYICVGLSLPRSSGRSLGSRGGGMVGMEPDNPISSSGVTSAHNFARVTVKGDGVIMYCHNIRLWGSYPKALLQKLYYSFIWRCFYISLWALGTLYKGISETKQNFWEFGNTAYSIHFNSILFI